MPGPSSGEGKYLLAVRVEGNDRKSFFAIAESPNGIDNFRFWDYPITMPEVGRDTTNVYDMRLTHHEDGYVYGLFCAERKDLDQPDNLSAAEAQCGIARTKDLKTWERLPDLITYSGQQRNVVLHPEFVEDKYAMYTRPQDGFISVGSGGGIGWGLSESMDGAEIKDEVIVDAKAYHTIKEIKNGQGPAPLKTEEGWIHLAHAVRNTAAGLRYVLYLFVTELDRPWQIKYAPAGHLIAPQGDERVGDVSNVTFHQWLDPQPAGRGIHLLRQLRYPHARSHHHRGTALRLRQKHPARRPHLRGQRPHPLRPHPPKPGGLVPE